MPITNLPENSNELITFHAGTTMVDNNLTASGGRVLAVTAVSNSREDSVDMAYEAAEQIEFIGCRYRSDIGRPAE
jgi:phosphoribosylamine-glycine ligase